MKTKIEQSDIIKIVWLDDGHCAFWTRDGYMACSCGWSDTDGDYPKYSQAIHDSIMRKVFQQ